MIPTSSNLTPSSTPRFTRADILAIVGLCVGTALAAFFGGFALGDKWSGIKRDSLIGTIHAQDQTIASLNEKIQILTQSKPELEALIASIKKEKAVLLSTPFDKRNYKFVGSLNLFRYQATKWQSAGIFFTYNGPDTTVEPKAFRLHASGFGTDDKDFELAVGQSIVLLIGGHKYFAIITGNYTTTAWGKYYYDVIPQDKSALGFLTDTIELQFYSEQ